MNPLGMWTSFRSNVESYTAVLGGRFVSLVWIGAICALIWFFGPKLALFGDYPLESVRNRIIAIAVVITVWGIWQLIRWRRAKRADAALIAGVTESPEARAATESREEVKELRDRLRKAMAMMRKIVRRRFGYTYEFPWYLLMGSPGAGKTTLLVNSGLKFPLGDALGAEPVRGVGGTRSCNWWFTDKAILIDTAGRYTTQDSGSERDKAGFLGFLAMLRSRRRAQPVNGVILTLSLTDMLDQAPEDRLREVRAIRQRLAEVADTLRARIPVYLVLTKADRLPGFTQFFETLGADGREQVWGMTFPLTDATPDGQMAGLFSSEYRALIDRLNGLLLERLQQESDIDRRGRIFRFPAQVGALHDPLREVIEELTSGTALVAAPMIRGMYFVSATQDETDRRLPTGSAARPMTRSYFVQRLFAQVILGEAALVSRDGRVTRRRRILNGLGYGLATGFVLMLVGSWTASYALNSRALAQTNADLTEYAQQAANIPVRDVNDADFLRVLPALNTLSEVPAAFNQPLHDPAFGLPLHRIAFSLGQENRIAGQYQTTYAQALGAYLLPRYMVALQNRLAQPDPSDADLFETLKHYLSLGGLGPIDRDGLLAQSEVIFAELYPGSGRAGTRAALQAHLVAMLDRGDLPVMAIDDALVTTARAVIGDRSAGQRAYDILATRPAARALPDWTPAAALGPAGAQVFSRASGAPLTAGIDGLLTREGYLKVLVPNLTEASEIAAGEGWVRGLGAAAVGTPSQIAADAVQLYWADFTTVWRDMVSDIVIRDVVSLQDAAELVALTASDANPLERLAQAVARQTDLTGTSTAPALPDGENPIAELPVYEAEAAALIASGNLPFDPLSAPDPYGPLRRVLDAAPPDVAPAEGETAIVGEFAALVPLLDQIYQQVNRVAASDTQASEVFAAESQLIAATQELVAAGRLLPTPADAWAVGLAGRVASAAVDKARQSVDALWRADGARECERAIEGRYPFDPDATADVTLDDFTRVFGPDGLFDSFFTEHLTEFVDVSTTPWSWKGGLGTAGSSSDALAQFERAAAIRTAFFTTAAVAPEVEVTFDLLELDPAARVALVEIGGESSVHGLDRAERRTLVWPGEAAGEARITLLPGERSAALQAQGEWAAFRLFDLAEITPMTDNQFTAAYRIAGRDVVFRVTSGSVNNPFRLPALLEFTCPDTL